MVASPFKLVLEHEIVSDADAKKIAKKLKTNIDKFPKILDTDPQVVKLGAKPGQLIAIHRKDPGVEYMHYRLVTKSA